MITCKLINLTTAQLAKEKGFNVPTEYYFEDGIQKRTSQGEELNQFDWNSLGDDMVGRPSQAELLDWLRAKHKLDVDMEIKFYPKTYKYNPRVVSLEHKSYRKINWHTYNSPAEAMEDSLVNALNRL